MVYRGLPSAGCKECRQSKKKCDLQWPVCARCVRLNRSCSGCKVVQTPGDALHFRSYDASSGLRSQPRDSILNRHISTGASVSAQPDNTVLATCAPILEENSTLTLWHRSTVDPSLPTYSINPNPDDIAINYFLAQFTPAEPGLWSFIRTYATLSKSDHKLDLVMRACGMAAFAGVNHVQDGAAYARSLYVNALNLLNAALGDPELRKADETLIAVRLLGVYETLTSGEQESFRSWKVHIAGVAQLLKLRGKDQLNSIMGRLLFREIEGEILIKCIWDEIHPPEFILDWEDSLEAMSTELASAQPGNSLTKICFSFATLRANLRSNTISDSEAAAEIATIDARAAAWASRALESNPVWRWVTVDVPDSPNVWNGLVHQYRAGYISGVWMAYRDIRIMILKTQELLCQRIQLSPDEWAAQAQSRRRTLRQLTDDICAAIPCMLRHDPVTGHPCCTLIGAYNAIWPLYLAGTCAVSRSLGQDWSEAASDSPGLPHNSASLAQAAWIIGRLEYIGTQFGLHWARYTAATLKRELELHRSPLLPERSRQYFFGTRRLEQLNACDAN